MRAKNIAAPVALFTPFRPLFLHPPPRLYIYIYMHVRLCRCCWRWYKGVRKDCSQSSSDIEMYLTKKKRISTWHGQPFCRRPSCAPACPNRAQLSLPPVLIMLRNVWRPIRIERRWKCKGRYLSGSTCFHEFQVKSEMFQRSRNFRYCLIVDG